MSLNIVNSFKLTPFVPPAEVFASMYETFQELTSLQVSHFVEWFSGSVLDSIWLKNTGNGSPLYAMNDEVDGGFSITTTAVGNFRGGINFNNRRHYAPDGSIMIAVWKSGQGTQNQHLVGFSSNIDIPLGLADSALSIIENGLAFFRLQTSASGTATRTSTDIAIDAAWHTHKVECTASDVDYYIDGVLKATNTTNLPAVAMQPYIDIRNNLAAVNSVNIRYFEAFNTSVTILSSLYERLSALTQVMNQRVVETFSGALLNERWTETGVGSAPMDDSIDGGCIINSDASQSSGIRFNDKRQYDFEDSVVIAIWKRGQNNSAQFARAGFINSSVSQNFAFCQDDVGGSFKLLRTADASGSSTSSSVATDINFHVTKIETGSVNTLLTIDGVLEVTKSTNRPTLKMQPIFDGGATGVTSTCSIRYLEAFNQLTTEADFPSVYELFNELTTIARQHFWEWFDGSVITNKWNKTITSSATAGIEDGIDEGMKITTAAINSSRLILNFNNKKIIDQDSSVCIFTAKINSINDHRLDVGFTSRNDIGLGTFSGALYETQFGAPQIDFSLLTSDGTTQSGIETDIVQDLVFHSVKIELDGVDATLTMDGVLKITKSTNYPTARMQPYISMTSVGGNAVSLNTRYYEAFNT